MSADLHLVRTGAIQDASLEGRPPVVVLIPGPGQPIAACSALAEDLASHGYAVVGITPSDRRASSCPRWACRPRDGLRHHRPSLLADVPGWYAAAGRITTEWVAGIAFVVETLGATAPAIGALDVSRVAYLGHSLGGASALQACADDARCAAAIDLDGTLWTDVRRTGLPTPGLLVQAEPDATCDAFCEAASAGFDAVEASGSLERASITGSRHMSFTDLGLLSPVPGVLDLGAIDASRMTVISRDLIRSFLEEHVRGSAEATLAAAVARYPEVR